MRTDQVRSLRFSMIVTTFSAAAILVAGILGLYPAGTAVAAEVANHEASADDVEAVDRIVEQWLTISEVMLHRHVDPPTRQEMLKAAVRAACQLSKQDPPRRLAATLSERGSVSELRPILRATLTPLGQDGGPAWDAVGKVGIHAILRAAAASPLPGNVNPSLIPLSEFYVQQQLRDNQYVGIGIQLGVKNDYPVMIKAFPRGPAWKAGGRDGDQMVSIDGLDAKGMPLTRVVELLRGQEGKPTTVVVRAAGSNEDRALHMIRGVVPFDTVLGIERDEHQQWRHTSKVDRRIGYLKFDTIRGSTPAEMRRIAGQLHAADCRAVILDFRRTKSGELRYAMMVANLLLGAGPIGEVLDARGRHAFDSNADQLFPSWPMAVVVDGSTVGQAEWIAAALMDSGRGMLVGQPTGGRGAIVELVELPDGLGGMEITTGLLFRRDGTPITKSVSADDPAVALAKRIGGASNRQERAQPQQGPNGLPMWAPQHRSGGLKPRYKVPPARAMAEAVRRLQALLPPVAPAGNPGNGAEGDPAEQTAADPTASLESAERCAGTQ